MAINPDGLRQVMASLDREHNDPTVPPSDRREVAIVRLTDLSVLAWIALSDPEWDLRLKALRRSVMLAPTEPSVCDLVARVAVSDNEAGVRAAAVSRLRDPAVLSQVARFDVDPVIRACAVRRISDPIVIGNVALRDGDPDVRATAVRRIHDYAVLHQLAESEPDFGVRRLAIDRMAVVRDQAAADTPAAPGM